MVLISELENAKLFAMKTSTIKRIYESIIRDHLKNYRQMVFLSGPRQAGKTFVAKKVADNYLNWDEEKVRSAIVSGQDATVERFNLKRLSTKKPTVVFDEIHKYPRWKNYLKGFFDAFEDDLKIIATGSAKMDIYKRGGDSMMGRYFPYRLHPLSVAELVDPSIPGDKLIRQPRPIKESEWEALIKFGGFPEPFVKRNSNFLKRWAKLRTDQLFLDDIRTLTQVQELESIRLLAEILSLRSGEQLNYNSLSKELAIDAKTAKKWVNILKYLYYGFEVKPWFKNLENSIRKTPKWYLCDWSQIIDKGKRYETLVACHLLKAVETWTDLGYGDFGLFYLRDKEKREVDFLVSNEGEPWFLAEVKASETKINPSLRFFQNKTKAKHAFQIVFEEEFIKADCFTRTDPTVVPAKTLLSQLV